MGRGCSSLHVLRKMISEPRDSRPAAARPRGDRARRRAAEDRSRSEPDVGMHGDGDPAGVSPGRPPRSGARRSRGRSARDSPRPRRSGRRPRRAHDQTGGDEGARRAAPTASTAVTTSSAAVSPSSPGVGTQGRLLADLSRERERRGPPRPRRPPRSRTRARSSRAPPCCRPAQELAARRPGPDRSGTGSGAGGCRSARSAPDRERHTAISRRSRPEPAAPGDRADHEDGPRQRVHEQPQALESRQQAARKTQLP